MRVVIQRVSKASVQVDSNLISSISEGLLILLGIENNDTNDDINWLIKKIANLRIFSIFLRAPPDVTIVISASFSIHFSKAQIFTKLF